MLFFSNGNLDEICGRQQAAAHAPDSYKTDNGSMAIAWGSLICSISNELKDIGQSLRCHCPELHRLLVHGADPVCVHRLEMS